MAQSSLQCLMRKILVELKDDCHGEIYQMIIMAQCDQTKTLNILQHSGSMCLRQSHVLGEWEDDRDMTNRYIFRQRSTSVPSLNQICPDKFNWLPRLGVKLGTTDWNFGWPTWIGAFDLSAKLAWASDKWFIVTDIAVGDWCVCARIRECVCARVWECVWERNIKCVREREREWWNERDSEKIRLGLNPNDDWETSLIRIFFSKNGAGGNKTKKIDRRH